MKVIWTLLVLRPLSGREEETHCTAERDALALQCCISVKVGIYLGMANLRQERAREQSQRRSLQFAVARLGSGRTQIKTRFPAISDWPKRPLGEAKMSVQNRNAAVNAQHDDGVA